MIRTLFTEALDGSPIEIGSTPIPLSLPVGSAIFAYSGTVWITQEGMLDDVIVAPGEHYAVCHRGGIVISAVRESAKIWVASPTEIATGIERDAFTLLRARAGRLRRGAFGDAWRATRELLARQIAAATATLRQALEPARHIARH